MIVSKSSSKLISSFQNTKAVFEGSYPSIAIRVATLVPLLFAVLKDVYNFATKPKPQPLAPPMTQMVKDLTEASFAFIKNHQNKIIAATIIGVAVFATRYFFQAPSIIPGFDAKDFIKTQQAIVKFNPLTQSPNKPFSFLQELCKATDAPLQSITEKLNLPTLLFNKTFPILQVINKTADTPLHNIVEKFTPLRDVKIQNTTVNPELITPNIVQPGLSDILSTVCVVIAATAAIGFIRGCFKQAPASTKPLPQRNIRNKPKSLTGSGSASPPHTLRRIAFDSKVPFYARKAFSLSNCLVHTASINQSSPDHDPRGQVQSCGSNSLAFLNKAFKEKSMPPSNELDEVLVVGKNADINFRIQDPNKPINPNTGVEFCELRDFYAKQNTFDSIDLMRSDKFLPNYCIEANKNPQDMDFSALNKENDNCGFLIYKGGKTFALYKNNGYFYFFDPHGTETTETNGAFLIRHKDVGQLLKAIPYFSFIPDQDDEKDAHQQRASIHSEIHFYKINPKN